MILVHLFKRWLCLNGWHGKVVWRKQVPSDARQIASRSTAAEMFVASGMLDTRLAPFIGCCQRCGHALRWASFNPAAPSSEADRG